MTEPGWPGLEELAPKAALTPASIFGQFYQLSRVRVALAQLSAQKLQRSFAALIGCRSPQEFFRLQNQLVKEQLELLAASIYGPFLNLGWQRSNRVKSSI
jgi:hypothetical protein